MTTTPTPIEETVAPATEYLICLAIDGEDIPATEAGSITYTASTVVDSVDNFGVEVSRVEFAEESETFEVPARAAITNPNLVFHAENEQEAYNRYYDLLEHNRPNGDVTLYRVESMTDDKYDEYFDALMADTVLDEVEGVDVLVRASFAGRERVRRVEQSMWVENLSAEEDAAGELGEDVDPFAQYGVDDVPTYK